MASFYKSSIDVFLPNEKTFLLVKSAIEQNFQIVSLDPIQGEIFARSGVSFSSFGENIIAICKPDELNEKCKVFIASECKVATTLVDWGKNKRNVTEIFNYIKYVLSKTE